MVLLSSSDRGLKLPKVFRLSSTCSIVDMPLNMTFTLGRLPTQRRAKDATDADGSRLPNIPVMSSAKAAREPPLIGSIITRGTFFSSVSL